MTKMNNPDLVVFPVLNCTHNMGVCNMVDPGNIWDVVCDSLVVTLLINNNGYNKLLCKESFHSSARTLSQEGGSIEKIPYIRVIYIHNIKT